MSKASFDLVCVCMPMCVGRCIDRYIGRSIDRKIRKEGKTYFSLIKCIIMDADPCY